MKAVEVLAPAGGWDALEAGVRSGADAVYLGGPAFGARASAKNFTREELENAAAFCHARGVRLHVTVNTLLKDRELPQAVEFVRFLCSLPVDAVLVQDLGLFAALRRLAPELPLHCSTQMSLHTPAGVRLLWELGASRVVLAREMSLQEIREARNSCPVELEAFVHGALCMSVSGQCYLSAMLGGRSGNRGMCAQPCRLPFAAPGGTGHDLSLKDLSLLERARDVVRAAPSWRAGLERVFDLFFHGSQNGVFTLELEDVQHLFRHMTPEEQREFWEGLSEFYRALLALWDIPASQQEYQLVQNMVSTLLLAYHSRLYASLPFAPGLEEETMSLQVKLIIDYLEDLHREHAAG